MSLVETEQESYDDARARKALARAIKSHRAKAAELADMHAAIEGAEAKLAAMQEAIDKSAHVEDAIAEAAAEALRLGTEISERSDAWRAKQWCDRPAGRMVPAEAGLAVSEATAVVGKGLQRANCSDELP